MRKQTKTWWFKQLKGFFLLICISIVLAAGMNIFRDYSLPWIEKRRHHKFGERFPYVPLLSTEIPEYLDYLGLTQDKKFITITDIQADLLVLEVLNVFCFPCQTQALTLNKACKMIGKRPDLKGRIKILGIALGNRKKVVASFMKDYDLIFPLISDPDSRIEKIIGPGIYTPFSMFIRHDDSGRLGMILGTYEGVVEDAEIMFDALVQLLEMEPNSVNLQKILSRLRNDKKNQRSNIQGALDSGVQ